MNKELLKELIEKRYAGTLTQEEKARLSAFIHSADNQAELEKIIDECFADASVQKADAEILELIYQKIMLTKESGGKNPALVSRMVWKRIAVAASIVFAVVIGGYFLFFNKSGKQPPVVKTNVTHDVPAPIARATLKLDDGTIVYLDSVGNGRLATQGNVNVVKLSDGQINYQIASSQAPRNDEVKYNTISNPRGSKVQTLTLIDGTQVWLNAESSITYPTAFIGNERKVEITGEAYFEVTHDAKKKFIVDANGITTEVLGTHFNVNTYADEDMKMITLLEGSIKVSNGSSSEILKPGEQAQITNDIKVEKDVDVNQVIAWQRGMFELNKTELPVIMRQISRWYDVDVIYETKPTDAKYGGGISRNRPLSNILKVLEANGVKFRIEGNKLYVRP